MLTAYLYDQLLEYLLRLNKTMKVKFKKTVNRGFLVIKSSIYLPANLIILRSSISNRFCSSR